MTTWIALGWIVIIAAASSPLVLRRRMTWLRLVASLASLALITTSVVPLVGSPFEPAFASGLGSFVVVSEKAFVAAWWLLLARVVISASQIAVGINHHRHAARLLSDLAAGAVYLGAVLAIIDLGFGVSVAGLVATSGIIAIVLGLALQSTLSDLFSGVAIGIDRPFRVGDLVLIEGAAEGRVIETNWRSTRVATGTNDVATVPNSIVAKARITNRSAPSEAHVATVKIMVDPDVPPREAIAMLRGSALGASLIPHGTPIAVVCTDLRGEAAVYEVQFSIAVSDLRDARSDLLNQIARHARYNGMALAPQDGTSLKPVVAPGPRRLLADVPTMVALGDEEGDGLASRLIRHEGDAGQTLFTQGGSLTSLFVIGRGTFDVSRDMGHGPQHLGTMGPGDYFGELALLTGSPNAVTVTALTPFLAYEVTKEMIAPLLQTSPGLLHALESAASKAQLLLDRTIAAQACLEPPTEVRLIDRIRAFFNDQRRD